MTGTATSPLRILVWTTLGPGNGVFHYRVNAPLAEASWLGLVDVTVRREISFNDVRACDVLMVPALLMHQVSGLVEQLGESRPLVVIDNDDDNLRSRADNPTWSEGEVTYEQFIDTYVPLNRAALRAADLITVTVPQLRDAYSRETEAPIAVLPNTVDEVLLQIAQPLRQPGERLRVGWAGSATHLKDWRHAAAGIRYGLRKADAHLVVMGSDFRPLVGHKDAEFLPWANSMDEYYLPLTTWHVALAPLVDDEFNRCKSPIKALEAGALGVPIVASAAGPYLDYVVDGETGFLCRTEDDWMKALRTLGSDEEMRRAMGSKAREHAAQLTTQAWAPRWVETYRAAIAARRGPVTVA